MTKSTNYRDTLITASPDSPVSAGTVPEKPGTVAAVQHGLLATPYAITSDDLLHAAHRARGGDKSREDFFARPQACLRASPLVKQYGWGVHHDGEGRIALLGMESAEYRRLLDDPAIAKTPGMRRAR
ncbi:MAG: hypothetical protein IIZ38_09395 [Sphingomonas sp.]|uniref:DUF6157 family protein n=1 Tax=Sphingomonas sp. TaxID=28214 RepID=UPI0025FAA2F8|nr:DUF6157 family protein [Sphingomonas sp.]MBQ1498517.1 hypothetical protein [Sphingomonas sp.]